MLIAQTNIKHGIGDGAFVAVDQGAEVTAETFAHDDDDGTATLDSLIELGAVGEPTVASVEDAAVARKIAELEDSVRALRTHLVDAGEDPDEVIAQVTASQAVAEEQAPVPTDAPTA